MNTIQSFWEEFKVILPKDAPDIQIVEMKKAFYAGAGSILKVQYDIGDKKVSEEAALAILSGLNEEIIVFAEELLKREIDRLKDLI